MTYAGLHSFPRPCSPLLMPRHGHPGPRRRKQAGRDQRAMRAGRGRPSHARMQRAAAARLDMLPAAAADPAAPRQRFAGKYLRGEKKHERVLVICAKVFARMPGTRIAPPGQARARCITWLPAEPCSGAIRQVFFFGGSQHQNFLRANDRRASHQGRVSRGEKFSPRGKRARVIAFGRAEERTSTKSCAIARNLDGCHHHLVEKPSDFFPKRGEIG